MSPYNNLFPAGPRHYLTGRMAIMNSMPSKGSDSGCRRSSDCWVVPGIRIFAPSRSFPHPWQNLRDPSRIGARLRAGAESLLSEALGPGLATNGA
jgi:hypothetical protein